MKKCRSTKDALCDLIPPLIALVIVCVVGYIIYATVNSTEEQFNVIETVLDNTETLLIAATIIAVLYFSYKIIKALTDNHKDQ